MSGAQYMARNGAWMDAPEFPKVCDVKDCGRALKAHRKYNLSYDVYNALPYEEVGWYCVNHGKRYYVQVQPGTSLKGVRA